MKRLLGLVVFLLAFYSTTLGQRQNLAGWCEKGNETVLTDGRNSTTKVQRSYPSCTVTVFDAGTLNLATIASDLGGTPKANPFVATTNGYWDFWALPARYDVRISGSGLATPFTFSNLWIAIPGGGSGDVVGPGSSTDEAIVRFDGTTGKLLQNSLVTLSDIGALTLPDDVRQTFNPGANNAGFNPGSSTADPASPQNGDMYYNSSLGAFRCRASGVWANCLGLGDVVGPGSSTDNAIARFDLATGKIIQNSVVIISDTGNVTGLGTLNSHTLPGGTDTIALLIASQTFSNKVLTNTVSFSGFYDMTRIAAPANPSAGSMRIFANDSTGLLACLTSAGANCMPSGGGGGSPGGANGAVQFNNAGAFGGDTANFFWDDANNRLALGTNTPSTANLTINTATQTGIIMDSGSGDTLSLSVGAAGVVMQSGGSGDTIRLAANQAGNALILGDFGDATFTPAARTGSGVASFNVKTPADLDLTASEKVLIYIGGDGTGAAVTRNFVAAFALQREYRVIAPNYTTDDASDMTTAVTFDISGRPTGDVVIANALAFRVASGNSQFAGDVNITGALDVDTTVNIDGSLVVDTTALVSGAFTAAVGASVGGQLTVDGGADIAVLGTTSINALVVAPGAYLDATAEVTDEFFLNDRAVNFTAGGAIANQRTFRITQPTFDADGARTLTKAVTISIAGAPIASTNITITNGFALSVESGNVGLGTASTAASNLRFFNASNANILTVSTGVTSTSYTWTFPLAAPGSTQCLQMDSSGTVTTTGSACGGGGSSPPFVDTTSIVEGSADNTKEIRFEVDGLTTATIRVLTPPDANITIAGADFLNAWADGVTQTFNPNDTSAGINVGSNNAEPASPNDGDLFYDGDGEQLKARINGAWVALGAGGSGCTVAGSTGDYQVNNGAGGCAAGVITQGTGGRLTMTPLAITSGVTGYLRLITPADADMTTNTESIGICIGGTSGCATVTRNFVDGTTYALQREIFIPGITYSFDGATTVTDAVSMEIAPPVAGGSATLTRRAALGFNVTDSGALAIHMRNADVGDQALITSHDSGGQVRLEIYRRQIRFFEADALIQNTFSGGNMNFGSGGTTGRLFIDSTGIIGINIISSIGAQLHTVSGATTRIGSRVDSAANSTVDLLSYLLIADDTSTIAGLETTNCRSNGTAATGFGCSWTFNLESSTTNDRNAARMHVFWFDATDASRTSTLAFATVENGNALVDRLTIRGGGTFSAIWIGNGETAASPLATAVIAATGGVGTNIAATALNLQAGPSTGTGAPGQLTMSFTTQSTSSGTTVNAVDAGAYKITATQFTTISTATIANSTTETTMIGTMVGGDNVIGAGVLNPGRSIVIEMDGIVTKTAGETLTMRFKTDGGLSFSKVFTSASTLASNSELHCRFVLTGRTFSATGTVFVQGACHAVDSATATTFHFATGASTATVTLDLTTAQTIDLTAQWSAADAGDTVSITNIISRWAN